MTRPLLPLITLITVQKAKTGADMFHQQDTEPPGNPDRNGILDMRNAALLSED